jgi:hypothetical protein
MNYIKKKKDFCMIETFSLLLIFDSFSIAPTDADFFTKDEPKDTLKEREDDEIFLDDGSNF